MRLKDADALIKWVQECGAKCPTLSVDKLFNKIKDAPTIDAVPVVRCKDCKHYKFADNRALGMPVKRCEWTGFEDVDDNDFCSRGERSEE